MDLALLRTFVTVHRAGSFTRAAALLGLSQPAVTSQIRTLERQLGRPLFLRQARGVTPTTIGDELAHKAAPHLDALVEIAESGLDDDSSLRTLHLAGPPEFTAERAPPALTELTGDDGQGFALRASFGTAEEVLDGLACGHHDLAISTTRPRGALFTATPLCDEELVLVAAPRWAGWIGPGRPAAEGRARPGEPSRRRGPRVAALRLALLGLRLRRPPGRLRHGHRPRPAGRALLRDRRGRARGTAPLPVRPSSGRGHDRPPCTTRRCRRCARISWWRGPARSPCRTSRGPRSGFSARPRPGADTAGRGRTRCGRVVALCDVSRGTSRATFLP